MSEVKSSFKYAPTIRKSILAGFMISMGGTAFLFQENKLIGSCLFTIGLFAIVFFSLSLFTGKIGTINKTNWVDILLTLIFNFLGTFIFGYFIYVLYYDKIAIKAIALVSSKATLPMPFTFFSAICCGILMYIAVLGYKEGNHPVISVALPVIVFINCGFDHCIANAFYFAAGGFNPKFIPYLLVAIAGNTVGALIFRALRN
ncbi:MAG: formate/nitrite transporter family protein [Lachnospiraceae bacterium]|jgi:formate/nitrite transporter FocA (FNT family)|nr:formate/nitrite transporter family protein [Lachnospiraceae bacterium]